jgi:hypothetical protein
MENQRREKNRITAEKVQLDLRWITKPAKDIDAIRTLFVTSAEATILNAHNVIGSFAKIVIPFHRKDAVKKPDLQNF